MIQRTIVQKTPKAYLCAFLATLLLASGFAFSQEAEEQADEEGEALELQDVRVTGSRLSRPPSELSGNLIVLDQADIRASGELTLARVLRQLPQNINATNEAYSSTLNGAVNRTGAATVNLRGLGSESTLILVDGRRVGYSGILGAMTHMETRMSTAGKPKLPTPTAWMLPTRVKSSPGVPELCIDPSIPCCSRPVSPPHSWPRS